MMSNTTPAAPAAHSRLDARPWAGFWRSVAWPLAVNCALVGALCERASASDAHPEAVFVAFENPSAFSRTNDSHSGEVILTSAEIPARFGFTEVVLSWNATMPTGSWLKAEARALYDQPAPYYCLGFWTGDTAGTRSHSIEGQNDSQAKVATDTLVLRHPSRLVQLRFTLAGSNALPQLKFVGVSLANPGGETAGNGSDHKAWGKVIDVLERSQMPYPEGKVWCSPATVSMLLSYWATNLGRRDLDRPVPEVAAGVYDAAWKGTGNWAFNMAYAGSIPGIRAYVTRFTELSEIEGWIDHGIPVGMSVDYDRLRGKGPGPNGHLVVCVGFTADGDPVINDPGTTEHVRKIFSRRNLLNAWSCSRNTVYLVYPVDRATPPDRFGHWAGVKMAPR